MLEDDARHLFRYTSPVLALAHRISVLRNAAAGAVWIRILEAVTPIIQLPYVEDLKNPDGTIALDVTAPQLWDLMPDYFGHELASEVGIKLWEQVYIVTDSSKRIAFFCEMIPDSIIDHSYMHAETYLVATNFRKIFMKSSFYGTVAYYEI